MVLYWCWYSLRFCGLFGREVSEDKLQEFFNGFFRGVALLDIFHDLRRFDMVFVWVVCDLFYKFTGIMHIIIISTHVID